MTPSELSPINVECAEAMGFNYHKQEVWPKRRPKQFEYILQSHDQESKVLPEFTVSSVDWDKERVLGQQKLPNYTEDANEALTLAKALADEGWTLATLHYDGKVECAFSKTWPPISHEATAPTFAIALCQAFLAVHRSKKA